MAGGALFNNLDYSFTAGYEDGTFEYPDTQPGGGSVALRKQFSYLKSFMQSFDFINMRPDSSIIKNVSSKDASVKILANPGKEYAAHIIGGKNLQLQIALPTNKYAVTWIDPVPGA